MTGAPGPPPPKLWPGLIAPAEAGAGGCQAKSPAVVPVPVLASEEPVGVSLGSRPWVFRPVVGGGLSRITLDSGTVVLSSEKRLLLYGGALVGRMIAETALLGVEVRAMRVGDLGNSVSAYLTLGTSFGS